jgi:hypothetical protein
MSIDYERFRTIWGLLTPEGAEGGRRETERFVDTGAKVFAAGECWAWDDACGGVESCADFMGETGIGFRVPGEIEEESGECRARRVAGCTTSAYLPLS